MPDEVTDGLNGPTVEFRKINAWAATAGTAGAFRRAALNVEPFSSAASMPARDMALKGMETSKFSYTSLS